MISRGTESIESYRRLREQMQDNSAKYTVCGSVWCVVCGVCVLTAAWRGARGGARAGRGARGGGRAAGEGRGAAATCTTHKPHDSTTPPPQPPSRHDISLTVLTHASNIFSLSRLISDKRSYCDHVNYLLSIVPI